MTKKGLDRRVQARDRRTLNPSLDPPSSRAGNIVAWETLTGSRSASTRDALRGSELTAGMSLVCKEAVTSCSWKESDSRLPRVLLWVSEGQGNSRGVFINIINNRPTPQGAGSKSSSVAGARGTGPASCEQLCPGIRESRVPRPTKAPTVRLPAPGPNQRPVGAGAESGRVAAKGRGEAGQAVS